MTAAFYILSISATNILSTYTKFAGGSTVLKLNLCQISSTSQPTVSCLPMYFFCSLYVESIEQNRTDE